MTQISREVAYQMVVALVFFAPMDLHDAWLWIVSSTPVFIEKLSFHSLIKIITKKNSLIIIQVLCIHQLKIIPKIVKGSTYIIKR